MKKGYFKDDLGYLRVVRDRLTDSSDEMSKLLDNVIEEMFLSVNFRLDSPRKDKAWSRLSKYFY